MAGRALLVALTVAACSGALAQLCSPNQYTLETREKTKCCDHCSPVVEVGAPCDGITDEDCKCGQGYMCTDSQCSVCTKTPTCERGKEPTRTGIIHYNYKCETCPPGTYSDKQNGYCKTWTDCESQGLEIKEAGTLVHNMKCGLSGMSKAIPESQGLYMSTLAILTAVAIFILILGTIFLHLYIWRMKKEKLFVPEDGGGSSGNNLIHPLEDSCSFQFPEEEHGGKKAEEDDAVDDAWMSLKENLMSLKENIRQ